MTPKPSKTGREKIASPIRKVDAQSTTKEETRLQVIAHYKAHNLRTPEYMRNIGETKIYLVPQLVADNEHWINPRFGDYDLQTHYDNIKQMVKAKAGRAMQKKERERKTKSGKIIKVAGCSPIREGVLLIKPDTTLEDVRRFGEECQERWGITPLQIFLHKDEGHWLAGEPSQTIRRVFKSVVVDSNPIITLISFSIG